MIERDLGASILKTFGALPWLRIFRRHVGDIYLPDLRTRIKVGFPGMADYYGWTDTGLHLEIETKSSRGGLSPPQRNFRDVCLRMNVLWILARSTDDVRDALIARGYGDRFPPADHVQVRKQEQLETVGVESNRRATTRGGGSSA